jgi:hypothetical protein
MAVVYVGQRDILGARCLSLPGECPPVHIVVAMEFFSHLAIIAPMLWAYGTCPGAYATSLSWPNNGLPHHRRQLPVRGGRPIAA